MKTILAVAFVVMTIATGCAQPCASTCDCAQGGTAPIKCPGRWQCNAQRSCEYACSSLCDVDGGGCANGETCSGSFCVPVCR